MSRARLERRGPPKRARVLELPLGQPRPQEVKSSDNGAPAARFLVVNHRCPILVLCTTWRRPFDEVRTSCRGRPSPRYTRHLVAIWRVATCRKEVAAQCLPIIMPQRRCGAPCRLGLCAMSLKLCAMNRPQKTVVRAHLLLQYVL